MDDYISKPVSKDALVAMVAQWVPRPTNQPVAAA
jgi:CheY-like chemotaxis protein